MRELSRRRFVKTAVATTAVAKINLLSYPADAAEFSYKYANNLPADFPMTVRTAAAAERLKNATSGRFDLQIFPNGQLGSDSDMLSQVRSGAIEFYTGSGSAVLSTLVPVAAINALGFAFKNYDTVWAAMDGDLGAYLRREISNRGLYALPKAYDNGFRQVTSATHPINTIDDLNGFKIRIPISELGVSMFKALGASPVGINWSEVYSSLQTRVVDGQENPLSNINAGKLYEVQKYCSITNHQWDCFWMISNRLAWQRLPKDLQELVEVEFGVAAVQDRKDIAALNDSLAESLKKKGLVFNEVDTEPFKAQLRKAGFYAQWKGKFGDEAWTLLEKYVGRLT
jgi:tripartite ATP-independent transporter DctP family solute receptor